MTLDSLACFCAVIDTGSFRLAADRVHRTQPAVSQQIKNLEREFRTTLVDRKSGSPTLAGKALYEKAKRLIANADDLARELRDFDESEVPELRVGASDTLALYYLPTAVRRFREAMPRTRLVMHTRSSDLVTEELWEGKLDLAIVTLPVTRDELEVQEVLRQNLVLIAPRRASFTNFAPLKTGQRITLRGLRNAPFVLLHEETRTGRLLREHFRSCDFEPQVALDGGSFEVIKRYVIEGLGVGIVPEIGVTTEERKTLSVCNVAGLPKIPIGAVRRRDAYETKAALAFRTGLSRLSGI